GSSEIRAPGTFVRAAAGFALAKRLEIRNGSIHAGHVFIDERPGFDFSGRLVGNEIFAKGWKFLEQLAAPPQKTHMRPEDFVARADKIVAIEVLHIDLAVRSVVHTIEENLGASIVGNSGCASNIY